MQQSQAPAKFLVPWANSAGPSYIRDIPVGSQIGINNGAASLETGFPPLNFLPVGSGGVPPFGQDMQGILKQITQWSRWQAMGALNLWDSAFATAIGGYPRGALLSSTTAGLAWLNTVDNNLTNPDGGGAAGWVPIMTGASVPQTSIIHAGPDTSTTPGVITIPVLTPSISSLLNYTIFEIVPALDIVGPTNVQIQAYGSLPLKRNDGGDVKQGDGPAGRPFLVAFFNGALRYLSQAPSEIASYLTNGGGQTTVVNLIQNNFSKGSLIGRQNYAAPGTYTYTPTSSTVRLIRVTVIGGGGGGGGVTSTDANSYGAGGGGGGGGTAVADLLLSSAGVSGAAIVVGAGGSGVNSNIGGNIVGGTGGTSSFSSFLSATGGGGGHSALGLNQPQLQVGGTKGIGAGGNVLNVSGQTGFQGSTQSSVNFVSGAGGTSYFGGGGVPRYPDAPGAGNASDTIGSGGGGAAISMSTPGQPGGAGAAGAVLIEEYA